MNIIPCTLHCKFQNDGYCDLEHTTKVNSIENGCAYYVEKPLDNIKASADLFEPERSTSEV